MPGEDENERAMELAHRNKTPEQRAFEDDINAKLQQLKGGMVSPEGKAAIAGIVGAEPCVHHGSTRSVFIRWVAGPPTQRGAFWIVWFDRVDVVEIGPALIHRHNPDAPLLIKLLGGAAYSFIGSRGEIKWHALVEKPEPPR